MEPQFILQKLSRTQRATKVKKICGDLPKTTAFKSYAAKHDPKSQYTNYSVLSVLAPTWASGISGHRFGQGWMLLTIIGYPLALRCVSNSESRPRVSLNN